MMFRKSISLICCWWICIALAAQTTEIDSLERLLSSVGNNSMERSKLLIELSYEYVYVDTSKSKSFALEALALAQSIRSEFTEAAAYKALASSYMVAHHPYLAHVNYKKAEKMFLKLEDRESLYKVYQNLMILFLDIYDAENAVYYANKVQEMAIEQNDLANEIQAQFVLGWARFIDNEGEEALNYYLDMYQKSLPLNAAITNFIALHCGQILILQNQPHEALKYLHPAKEHFEASGIIVTEIFGYLAEAYAMINQADSAEYYMRKAYESPFVTDETKLILSRCRSLLHLKKGDYKNALNEFHSYHQLYDSIAKAGKTTEMARIKVWHEFDQKELENRILHQEHQKQQKLNIILAILLLMTFALFAIAVFFSRKISEKNREITAKNIEMEELHTVKDKLFSVVAHDLRSPIAALMSVLKLTHMNILDVETQAKMLKDISKRVDDVYGLLDNLLRWAKNQMQGMVISPVYFDVQNEIRAVVDGLQEIAAAKMIALNNHTTNHEIFADRDMFWVVVRNLASNALKYTSEGGEVTIDSKLEDNMLVVSIKDTGTGMPQAVQEKLFKLAETQSKRGTNNESGTGLGLVLCAEFVKANGGDIWFSSVQGEGSTFFFSIPLKNYET